MSYAIYVVWILIKLDPLKCRIHEKRYKTPVVWAEETVCERNYPCPHTPPSVSLIHSCQFHCHISMSGFTLFHLYACLLFACRCKWAECSSFISSSFLFSSQWRCQTLVLSTSSLLFLILSVHFCWYASSSLSKNSPRSLSAVSRRFKCHQDPTIHYHSDSDNMQLTTLMWCDQMDSTKLCVYYSIMMSSGGHS